MRVLAIGNVYPPHSLGGYEIVWRGAMQHLREQGHDARILTTDYRAPGTGADAADDLDVYRELRWYWRDHTWPRLRMRARLALERHNAAVFDFHVREFAPDVVTWWPMGGLSLSLIERARRTGLPAVLFVHDYWPTYGPERDLWTHAWAGHRILARVVERLTGLPARYDLATAGRWLFNSECVRAQTLASGVKVSGSDLLAPGIQDCYLRVGPNEREPQWHWRLLYAGRVVEQKGVHTAIHALSLLPAEATLRIVGEGDAAYRHELEQLARRMDVQARVSFEPSLRGAALVKAYRDADALVFPVMWLEPWGLVPLEAMALGTLVVATGQGGSGEYLAGEVNSLLFGTGDPSSLAAALLRLAGDPHLRTHLRAGGVRTAAGHAASEFDRRALEEITAALPTH